MLCCSFAAEDEESTIEEQEATEGAADQKAELADLTKEGKFYISDVWSCLWTEINFDINILEKYQTMDEYIVFLI